MTPVPVPDLRFVDDGEPGWRRRRRGRGFEYRDLEGTIARNDPRLARVQALAVPPAWTDVWICPDPRGHVQATGRDARGRKQYRYHPEWRAFRDRVKFDSMLAFGRALPDVRRAMEADLRLPALPRAKVVATVVRLLEATLIRVGNEEYAKANGSFGLTTLRHQHARLVDGGVRFQFVGKGGARHDIRCDDPRVARIVRRCEELPGQMLFQYVQDGEVHAIGSHDVNDYLRIHAGTDVSAKDYRTWMATTRTAALLARMPMPAHEAERAEIVRDVVERTAATLGNTQKVCRASYVHPLVIEAYAAGELTERWSGRAPRSPARLSADERRLLALLRAHVSSRRRTAAPCAVTARAA